ncbi:hypothetical protein FRC03_007831 [Tulasnella sp. 419]|nr:hypothetical protein FRC03_007831 [Tulasnella sp. 419]
MSDSSIGPYPPNLTPASLQIVSRAAPQLLSLSECFKAEWPTDYKQDLSPSVSSLESLDVGSSKLQQQVGYYDQSNVEKTLRHLFPKLRWIWWTHPFYFLEDLDDINWDDAPVDHVEYRDIGYTWEGIGNKLGGWSQKGLCPFLYE